jgi:DNA-directed RNA polymerase I, II, and III subunit RPABC1
MSDVEMSDAAEAPTTPSSISLSPEASRLFRVYKTISGMLDKRGYMIPKSMREMTPADFLQKFGEYPNREALTILVVRCLSLSFHLNVSVHTHGMQYYIHCSYQEKADDETNQLFVFFPEDEKVGVKPIKVYTDRMRTEGVSNAIMVLRVDITPFAKQAVQEMSDAFCMEHFKEAELLVDITQHQLVPQHELLTKSEKIELLKRYRLKETQLPRIQPNDPVARYYGMKRGNVVKIIRPSETAGRYVTYRICM